MESQNSHTAAGSRRKTIRVVALLVPVVLVATLFSIYLTPAHTWIASLFHSHVSIAPGANPSSETTMFGYDLQHTRDNIRERQLNIANVSSLQLSWSFSTTAQIISSPVVDHGILFIGSNNKRFYAL